jgi:hypothetical protein
MNTGLKITIIGYLATIKSKEGYVTVRTVDHQRGEIQGQIVPTSIAANCLTTMRFAPPSTMPSHSSTSY